MSIAAPAAQPPKDESLPQLAERLQAREAGALEALIERTRKRIDTIEDELANPALYEKDPVGATRLAKERSDLSGSLSRHEERWLELSEEYEAGIAE